MKKLMVFAVLAFAILSLTFVTTASAATRTIMVTEGKLSVMTANITKGTTVIWVNNAPDSVTISFTKGKEVEAVCAAPTRFALDAEGKYNSGAIPKGATASVCFIEGGKYEYTVTFTGRGAQAVTGKIVVK